MARLKPIERQANNPTTRLSQRLIAGQFTVYLGLNFEDKVDRIISRLILDELSEANRHVRNSPAITRIADEKSFPELLLKEYPKISEKFKCGMVTISNICVRTRGAPWCTYPSPRALPYLAANQNVSFSTAADSLESRDQLISSLSLSLSLRS